MFELADRLVGIYKTNDATKSVTINPRLFDQACGGQLAAPVGAPAGAAAVAKAGRGTTSRAVLGDATNTVKA